MKSFFNTTLTRETENLKVNLVLSWGFLFLWSLLQILIISKHELWLDETRPWILVRDLSFYELITNELRYDGHPVLWFILIKFISIFFNSVESIKLIQVILNICISYLIIFRSPFRLDISFLIVTSYMIAYQHGIVVRNYTLLVFLIFYLACLWKNRLKYSLIFSIVLALISNTHLYGLFISFAVVLHTCFESNLANLRQNIYKNFKEILIILVGMLFCVFTLYNSSHVHLRTPATGTVYLNRAIEIIKLAFYNYEIISILLLICFVFYFKKTKLFIMYLLPTLGIIVFCALKHYQKAHAGVVFCWTIACLWIVFEQQKGYLIKFKTPLFFLLLSLLLSQTYYTYLSYNYDYNKKSSGLNEARDLIIKHQLTNYSMVCNSQYCETLLAYFPNLCFQNWNNGVKPCHWKIDRPYRVWTGIFEQDKTADIIVVARRIGHAADFVTAEKKYTKFAHAEGGVWLKDRINEVDYYEFFCRNDLCPKFLVKK